MSEIISLDLDHLEMYKKAYADSFPLKRSSNKARLGTPKPLSLKTTRKPTKTPQKLGEIWVGHMLKR